MLAIEDLKDRYRRSYIGVAWIVLAFVSFISVKALIFSALFADDTYDFFSHLVIGFALFSYFSSTLSGAASLFVKSRTWILSTNNPYSLYMHTIILRGFFELALLAAAAAFLIGFLGAINPSEAAWTILPALVIYYVTGFGLALLLAPIGARFRDTVYAVQTLMRMLFFATPIIWVPTPGTIRGAIAQWNPLTYYLDIIRGPLMTGDIPVMSWIIVLAMTSVTVLIGCIVFGNTKRMVAIWL